MSVLLEQRDHFLTDVDTENRSDIWRETDRELSRPTAEVNDAIGGFRACVSDDAVGNANESRIVLRVVIPGRRSLAPKAPLPSDVRFCAAAQPRVWFFGAASRVFAVRQLVEGMKV